VLSVLALILFFTWDYVLGTYLPSSYRQVFLEVVPFLCAIGLFFLSRFISKQIFKNNKVIEYYLLTALLTMVFCSVAWLFVGVWEDFTGVLCSGFFGVRSSCFSNQLLSYVVGILPIFIALYIVAIIVYAIFGKSVKKKKQVRKK